MTSQKTNEDRVPFEDALNKAGFGLYSYMLTFLSGLTIMSFACVAYSTTIIVPASACELATTSAQRGLMAAAPLIGSIIGAFVWGYLGDTRGRQKMLIVSIILSITLNTVSSLSVNWVMLMVLQFFATMVACGKYTLSVTLLSECVPMANRNQVLLLVTCLFLIAQGLMAVLAIPVIPLTFSYHLPSLGIYWNSWRTMMVVYSVPSVICLICMFFIYESPKFLFTKGQEEKALNVLRGIHKVNHWRSDNELQVKGLLVEQSDASMEIKSKKDQIVPLFRMPLLKNTAIIAGLYLLFHVGSFAIWLPTIANQFMSIVETGEGSNRTLCGILRSALDVAPSTELDASDKADGVQTVCNINEVALLMVFVVGVLQATVNLVISMVISRTGRRNMVMFLSVAIGSSGIIINVIPNAIGSAVFFAIFLMGVVVLGLYTAMAVALFPTHLRAMAVSLAVAFGRIGTFASLQILNYLLRTNCEVGFYLFASMFTVSAAVAWLLPDDRLPIKPPPTDRDSEKQS